MDTAEKLRRRLREIGLEPAEAELRIVADKLDDSLMHLAKFWAFSVKIRNDLDSSKESTYRLMQEQLDASQLFVDSILDAIKLLSPDN